MNEEKRKEFEEKFCKMMLNISGQSLVMMKSVNPDILWQWIDSLLKELREKYYYHIENSVGTKEADYIDKMVNKLQELK